MFKTELYKQPKVIKYKKMQRGSFKVICFSYNKGFVSLKKNVLGLISQGSGFYYWKPFIDFQKRVGNILKKRKVFKLRFNFSLNWNFSKKTHKSRMGKGKGSVAVENWCSRIQSGRPIIFLSGKQNIVKSMYLRIWRSSLSLPVSIVPLFI